MAASLYLLVQKALPIFKIGVAKNVDQRIRQLGYVWGEINPEMSCNYNLNNFKQARDLENIIHKLFRKYNIQNLEDYNGYTEWYQMECFNDVKNEIHRINNLFFDNCCSLKEGLIKVEHPGITITKKIRPSKEELHAKYLRGVNECKQGNLKNWISFINIFNRVRNYIVGISRICDDSRGLNIFLEGTINDWNNKFTRLYCNLDYVNGGGKISGSGGSPGPDDKGIMHCIIYMQFPFGVRTILETKYIFEEFTKLMDSIVVKEPFPQWVKDNIENAK